MGRACLFVFVCVGRISKKVVGVIRWNFESQQPVGLKFLT